MSHEDAARRSLLTLMDVVETLTDRFFDPEHARVVRAQFDEHRQTLLDPGATLVKPGWPVRDDLEWS